MKKLTLNKTYYVYLLVDPRNKAPIYVGMGKRKLGEREERYLQHVQSARRGSADCNPRKFRTLRKILKGGYDGPSYQLLFESDSFDETSAAEIRFIHSYKIEHPETMTNLSPGGRGGIVWPGEHPMKGKKMPKAWRENLSAGRLGNKFRLGTKHGQESREKIKKARGRQFAASNPRMAALTSCELWMLLDFHISGYSLSTSLVKMGIPAEINNVDNLRRRLRKINAHVPRTTHEQRQLNVALGLK